MYPGNYLVLDGREGLSSGAGNFWCYVNGRDCVSAVAAAMDADIDGHEPYNVAAAENYLDRPTREAFEEFFGEVPEETRLSGEETALSVEKAQLELDWAPEHTWARRPTNRSRNRHSLRSRGRVTSGGLLDGRRRSRDPVCPA